MTDGATCSRDDSPAAGTCTRCGDFLCRDCMRFVDGSPLRYCDECLDRRTEHLKGRTLGFVYRNKPARVSVAFAVLAMCLYVVPFWIVGAPMAIWGIWVAAKDRGDGMLTSILGLLLNLGFAAIWVLVALPGLLQGF